MCSRSGPSINPYAVSRPGDHQQMINATVVGEIVAMKREMRDLKDKLEHEKDDVYQLYIDESWKRMSLETKLDSTAHALKEQGEEHAKEIRELKDNRSVQEKNLSLLRAQNRELKVNNDRLAAENKTLKDVHDNLKGDHEAVSYCAPKTFAPSADISSLPG